MVNLAKAKPRPQTTSTFLTSTLLTTIMLPVRQGFAFVCMTAVCSLLFFTHLLHRTDDPEQSTLSPKEWISILRTANLAERAAGLHQWVSNHSQGMLINSALGIRQFERLEVAENRLKHTIDRLPISSEKPASSTMTSNAELPTSILIYADKGEVKAKQYFDNKIPTSISTNSNLPSTLSTTETIAAMVVHNKTTKQKKNRPTREPRSTNKGSTTNPDLYTPLS